MIKTLIVSLTTVAAFNTIQQPQLDLKGEFPSDSIYAASQWIEEDCLLDRCEELLDLLVDAVENPDTAVSEDTFLELFEDLEVLKDQVDYTESERLQELITQSKEVYTSFLERIHLLQVDFFPSDSTFIADTSEQLNEPVADFPGYDNVTTESQSGMVVLPSVQLEITKPVMMALDYFQKRGRRAMQVWLNRAGEMIPLMQPILRSEGLPDEIVYLSMIESGFNAEAYSWAHASGPWQFISATGRRYGLTVNWWYDERRDIELSTRAAARYLKDLYTQYGDWLLAFAAYNCGEGRVNREIRRTGHNFWRMKRLPRQTRNYVPSFLAATIIATNPQEYGFNPPVLIDPTELNRIKITECIDLKALARCADIDVKTLKKHNPAIVRWCTPPDMDEVDVKVPLGTDLDAFWSRYASIPKQEKVSYARHKVRRGEALSTIAERYGVPMGVIMRHPMNNIRSPHRIKAGQIIIIPGIASAGSSPVKAVYDEPLDLNPHRVHIVKRGETLSEIAEKYHLSLSKLKRINGLYGKKYIYPNQRIKLYPLPDAPRETQTASLSGNMYVVRRGDSLWKIARQHGVSVKALRRVNGTIKRNIIKPGQRLVIP